MSERDHWLGGLVESTCGSECFTSVSVPTQYPFSEIVRAYLPTAATSRA